MGCPITRGVCRDSSVETASFRYYSVTAGAVPFHWEVEPGTPKHPNPGDSPILVPLAPPPSWLKVKVEESERSPDLEKTPGIIKSLLPKLKKKKKKLKYYLTRPASSPSNSSSSTSSTCVKSRVSWESSASTLEEESVEVKGSPTKSSFSCFGVQI